MSQEPVPLETMSDTASQPDSPLLQPTETQPKWLTQPTRSSRLSRWMRRLTSVILPIIRPRRSWKYFLSVAVVVYAGYCFIRGSPFFASKLPSYSGPHGVGAVDIETPLKKPRKVTNTTFRNTDEPAFQHETTLFTIYYPTSSKAKSLSNSPRLTWLTRPISVTAEGYAKFARIDNFIMRPFLTFALWALAGSIEIPATVDAPLLPSGDAGDSSKFPVIVFSHGTASSRTDYTNYLGELASRGYVVAAIEHRDGSCPGTIIKKKGENDRRLIHFREDDLSSMDTPKLKREQLAFRDAEIFHTIKILESINNGHGKDIFTSNPRDQGTTLESWSSRLDMSQLTIGGHSYGATGALQALKSAPDTTPAIGGIILDPGKESGPLNPDIDVPILVVHSSSWSSKLTVFFGRPHFDTVRDLVADTLNRTGAAWFLTSMGTSHPSVSDAPLIEPFMLSWTTGARMNTKEALKEYVHISEEFLDFLKTKTPTGLLAEPVTHEQFDQWVSEDRQKSFPPTLSRLWEIHVSPAGKKS